MEVSKVSETYRDRDTSVIPLAQFIPSQRLLCPPILVFVEDKPSGLLPPVKIPSFAISAHCHILGSLANALTVPAGATAYDEDLLIPPQGVDCVTDELGIDVINNRNLVDTREIEEEATFEVRSDVARVLEVFSTHEEIIGVNVGFHALEHDGS